MGIDAIIEFELPEPLSLKELNKLNFRLGESVRVSRYDKAQVTQDNPKRYEIYGLCRYYGTGYERGSLPYIINVLRFLKDYFDGNIKLFYGGDHQDEVDPWTPELENGLWQHFVKHGHAPYLRYDENHRCPQCDGPMWPQTWSRGKHYYTCQGCDFNEFKELQEKEARK
jgi:hypothetical protein